MSEAARLTCGSIRGHLVTQTLPMVVASAALMSVGLVDAYFVGQLGSAELAAMSFIFPVTISLASLGVGVMVGVNSVVARAIGAGDTARAARQANVGVAFALALGAFMGLALWLLTDPLFRLLQAPASLMPLIARYMGPFALGLPVLLLQMGLNGVLRAQGEAKRTSAVAVTYAAANWVLDPLLITGGLGVPALGVAGAAWATTIGYLLAVMLAAWLVRGTHLPLNPALVRKARLGKAVRNIVSVAGPAAFSNAINPIGLSVLTALLASQGQEAVAGYGAAGRLQSFATVPLLALSASIGAIVGQNWGAGQHDRARRAFFEAGAFCAAYGLALAAVMFAAGEWFAGFFTDDPGVIGEFARYMRIAAWGYAGFGLLIVANGALNAIGKANWSLGQSFARVFLVMLPVAWVLRPAWGSSAIYTGELAANVVGGALAAFIAWRMLSRR
ncbi:MATE family efflux transporter [Tsuneonella sp. YG55]|uniref:MATE family efflux transporter n=1 Tax=Tsuneonella litorea TaxID=2976475 RepID=A0A9X2W3B7_9SPHN|nr:MATE family efflux transporter [Tsuneonella litorea]MCT2559464.1 MATE family efflux transporter [Tsuneonella litorea]